MAGSNLRLAPAMRYLPQRFFERQRYLLGVPAAGQPGSYRLTSCEFHPEAREAQRSRPLRCGIALLVPEAIPGFLLTAARTQNRPAGLGVDARLPTVARSAEVGASNRRHPPVVQRELLNPLHLLHLLNLLNLI